MQVPSKKYMALAAVALLLLFTNPSIRDLKEHVVTDEELSVGFGGDVKGDEPRRVANFGIVSIFKRRFSVSRPWARRTERYERTYVGIAKNFLLLSESKVE